MCHTVIAVGLITVSTAQGAPWPGAQPPGLGGGRSPTPTEACCLAGGDCYDFPPDYCLSWEGTPQGPGTTCDDPGFECPRACCFVDGTCQDITPSACTTQGGTSLFGSCASINCPEACCFDGGGCEDWRPTLCFENAPTPPLGSGSK